jgi:hypothetical protein
MGKMDSQKHAVGEMSVSIQTSIMEYLTCSHVSQINDKKYNLLLHFKKIHLQKKEHS